MNKLTSYLFFMKYFKYLVQCDFHFNKTTTTKHTHTQKSNNYSFYHFMTRKTKKEIYHFEMFHFNLMIFFSCIPIWCFGIDLCQVPYTYVYLHIFVFYPYNYSYSYKLTFIYAHSCIHCKIWNNVFMNERMNSLFYKFE